MKDFFKKDFGKNMYKNLKRIIDLLISIITFPIVVLIILIFGVMIKLDDGGTIFYKAQRLGVNRKVFTMYKFRTMIENAPDYRAEDGSTLNSEDDPRLTKLGKFMRKTSIDEIPQLLNVLKGEMSIIGPRPDSAFWIDQYTDEEKIIHTVRPGITGYNQVINRNAASTKEKLKNDIYYVENISFGLDLWIFFTTIKKVFNSENVYREDLPANEKINDFRRK
ncbi:sugar transferase [Enterococcus gallinarum]|uniref:sugar transferase n=1 Tax=Enterococcus gallinarum TaxID=1353 RepID=UPI003D0B45FD